jgi:hypothetical protein
MEMKPGKTFKLSKQTKRFMATLVNAEERNSYKRAMIQAELAAAVVVKSAPRDKNAPRGQSNYVTNDTGTASTQA